MTKKTLNIPLLSLSITVLSLFVAFIAGGFLIQKALAAWSEPASAPPSNQPEPPVNIGLAPQIKSGGLGVASLTVDGGAALGIVSGNVGIGTTNPGALVHIQQNQNASTRLQVRNDTTGATARAALAVTLGDFVKYGAFEALPTGFTADGLKVADSLAISAEGLTAGLRLYTRDSANLTLGTGNTARVTIDTSGNLGIGTTDPQGRKLFVEGDMRATRYYDDDTSFYIDSNVTSRIAGLEVATQGLIVKGNSGGGPSPRIELREAGSGTYFGQLLADNDTQSVRLFTDDEKGIVIDNAGNVGIGTTGPEDKLHVLGNVTADEAGTPDFVQIHYNNAIIAGRGGSEGGLRFGFADNLSYLNWSEKMRIADNGNVGIGTTNPGAKLEVVGGLTKTSGGLVIEVRCGDPASPQTGQMCLNTC